MSEFIFIKLPITKNYFITFLNNFISIHFYNDQSIVLESLKNLLFPPEHSDKEFADLVKFIQIIFDEMIKNNKGLENIKKELKEGFVFDEEILITIMNVVNAKRSEILNNINSIFNEGKGIYTGITWSTKSILSSNRDCYYDRKYSEVDLSYQIKDVHEHKSLSFTKEDIGRLLQELGRIKENLNKINNI